MIKNLKEEALELHRRNGGKIAVESVVELNNRDDLSLAYTPGVASVCQEIVVKPEAVFDLTIKGRMVAVVSDGSAVLGLGNIGPAGALPVMEGKAALFKRFAGVDAFPICLATQDTEEIISAVKNIAPVFGGINLEDISAPRCFEIEERLRKELDIPVMHDDQHGTAVVVLAGLLNALKVRDGKVDRNIKIVVNGAGAAGTAVAKLLVASGFHNLIVCDSQGAINNGRSDLNLAKKGLAQITNPEKLTGSLAKILEGATVFIGVSKGGLLTGEMVRKMSSRPIIFALANPTPEIMPEEALSAGALLVATGRSDFPNQVNNVLAFPGLFKGALSARTVQFSDEIFAKAAEKLAGLVAEPMVDKILPDPFEPQVAETVASVFEK